MRNSGDSERDSGDPPSGHLPRARGTPPHPAPFSRACHARAPSAVDKSLSIIQRAESVGFVLELLSLSYELAVETEGTSPKAHWLTRETATDMLVRLMLKILLLKFYREKGRKAPPTFERIASKMLELSSFSRFDRTIVIRASSLFFRQVDLFRLLFSSSLTVRPSSPQFATSLVKKYIVSIQLDYDANLWQNDFEMF
jgi:hypothetical protein